MPLKGSYIALLANRLHLFPSRDGLRSKVFFFQNGSTAVCDTDRRRLFAVLSCFLPARVYITRSEAVSYFVRATSCATTGKRTGRIQIEAINVYTSASD